MEITIRLSIVLNQYRHYVDGGIQCVRITASRAKIKQIATTLQPQANRWCILDQDSK